MNICLKIVVPHSGTEYEHCNVITRRNVEWFQQMRPSSNPVEVSCTIHPGVAVIEAPKPHNLLFSMFSNYFDAAAARIIEIYLFSFKQLKKRGEGKRDRPLRSNCYPLSALQCLVHLNIF